MVLNLLSGATSLTEGTSNKRKKLTIGDVFNQDDEDSADNWFLWTMMMIKMIKSKQQQLRRKEPK